MARSAAWLALAVALVASPAPAGEDSRTAMAFLQGLRDRRLFDLAGDYLDRLKADPNTPKPILETIDYERGKVAIDEASQSSDIARGKDLLEQARGRLDAFVKEHPDHPKAPDALLQLARLLVERGHLAKLQADDAADETERGQKLEEARSAFEQGRAAYDTAAARLQASHDAFPKFLTVDDPRFAERETAHNGLMQARLNRAIVDYEDAQTHPVGSGPRKELMGKALVLFGELYNSYRTQFSGLAAQMWQGKCYEERGEDGDLGRALGIYNTLLEHADPRLRPLQRHVGYFRIIALGKRREYALAADEAVRWLQANNGKESLRSREGVGVQFELAKNLAAQIEGAKESKDREAVAKRIVETLAQVVRYPSPFKAEALALLKTYKPNASANFAEISRLNFENAIAQAEEALATREWDRARALLRQAIRRAKQARDIEKTNQARYNLAFCEYMSERYYDAVVLADHLARRYPSGGLSAKAAEIGMASLERAYNTYKEVDQTADLDNLIALARYVSEAFAEVDQGDTAKLALGQIYHGTGRYADAVAAYESVREQSSKWVEATTRAGASHWEQSKSLRRAGKAPEADAEVATALAKLHKALKFRQDTGATSSDPGLIGNACDIADILLETEKPSESLALLSPLAKEQGEASGPARVRLMSTLLRGHIATGQVDQAVADMAALEKAGGGEAGLTQLYFRLGRLLETETAALEKKGDKAGADRVRQVFLKFLGALAASQSGQTFDSMLWTGENILRLGDPKQALDVLDQALQKFGADPAFLSSPNAPQRVLRAELKRAASLRGLKQFDEASKLVERLLKENPRTIEPMIEKGMLLEDLAEAKKGTWAAAFNYWRATATRIGGLRTRPVEYYEAWYHAALALQKQGKPREALQTLAGIVRLSPSVGGPEMKSRYQSLMNQIQ